jgi:hypothetical protein
MFKKDKFTVGDNAKILSVWHLGRYEPVSFFYLFFLIFSIFVQLFFFCLFCFSRVRVWADVAHKKLSEKECKEMSYLFRSNQQRTYNDLSPMLEGLQTNGRVWPV